MQCRVKIETKAGFLVRGKPVPRSELDRHEGTLTDEHPSHFGQVVVVVDDTVYTKHDFPPTDHLREKGDCDQRLIDRANKAGFIIEPQ